MIHVVEILADKRGRSSVSTVFSVLPCVLPVSLLYETLLWRENLQQRGQGGLQLLYTKGWQGRTLGREGNFSYMRVSLGGHHLYLVKKGYNRGGGDFGSIH